jgi:transposase
LKAAPRKKIAAPVALTRKNALFVGHEVGVQNWALLASVVATCKLNDLDPVSYIAQTLQAMLDGHLQSRIDELTPWRFAAASSPVR